MIENGFEAGDLVVYRRQKSSTTPGKRAKSVVGAAHGDTYNYFVEKYWIVQSRLDDGQLSILTRTGKQHIVRSDDPNLRRARWWERIFLRSRFPAPPEG